MGCLAFLAPCLEPALCPAGEFHCCPSWLHSASDCHCVCCHWLLGAGTLVLCLLVECHPVAPDLLISSPRELWARAGASLAASLPVSPGPSCRGEERAG